MKKVILLFGFFSLFLNVNNVFAQADSTQEASVEKYSKITKNDGTTYVGVILSMDAREVLIKTKNLGEIIIPKHQIRSIEEVQDEKEEVTENGYPRNLLASRYSVTTNGFPVRKGEGYARFMLAGVDLQFAITDNWSIGGMTSWIGVPIIVTSKYSGVINDNMTASAGFLYGNLMHGAGFSGDPALSYGGGIGFANLTFGNEENNFNISGGYGFVHFPTSNFNPITQESTRTIGAEGAGMFSIAGMYRIGEQASFVFDSMALVADGDLVYWINPAIRYMPKPVNIWQFGVNMVGYNDFLVPLPIPSISFTKVFKK